MLKDDLTFKIIGCAMKVHTQLGPGFQEAIYQKCLSMELDKTTIKYEKETDQLVYYDNVIVGLRRADFIVEGKVVIEIKALAKLEDVHLAQAKNYTVAYNYPLGLLINFGSKSLEHKLLFNPKFHFVPGGDKI